MTELNPQQQPPPADHSVKIPHLVFGLLFLGIAVVWALVVGDVITEDRLTVIAPGVLIAAGVIGLAASLATSRNRRGEHQDIPYHDNQPNDDQQDHNPVEPEHDHTQEIR
jgi:ABC-type nickel/cobalt efflux system permease component RcnA